MRSATESLYLQSCLLRYQIVYQIVYRLTNSVQPWPNGLSCELAGRLTHLFVASMTTVVLVGMLIC